MSCSPCNTPPPKSAGAFSSPKRPSREAQNPLTSEQSSSKQRRLNRANIHALTLTLNTQQQDPEEKKNPLISPTAAASHLRDTSSSKGCSSQTTLPCNTPQSIASTPYNPTPENTAQPMPLRLNLSSERPPNLSLALESATAEEYYKILHADFQADNFSIYNSRSTPVFNSSYSTHIPPQALRNFFAETTPQVHPITSKAVAVNELFLSLMHSYEQNFYSAASSINPINKAIIHLPHYLQEQTPFKVIFDYPNFYVLNNTPFTTFEDSSEKDAFYGCCLTKQEKRIYCRQLVALKPKNYDNLNLNTDLEDLMHHEQNMVETLYDSHDPRKNYIIGPPTVIRSCDELIHIRERYKGDLYQLIDKAFKNQDTQHLVKRILHTLYHAALGLSFVHERGFVHYDARWENFFIDKDNKVKIGDFALARPITAQAPYVQNGEEKYGANYQNISDKDLLDVHCFGWQLNRLFENNAFANVPHFSSYENQLKELIHLCTTQNLSERISMLQVAEKLQAMLK